MACTLTSGMALDCRDSVGGLKNVYISEFGNVSAFTVVAGEITAITQVTSTNFFIYNLEKENGDFLTTENVSVENGTTFYESVLNFTLKKMVASTSEELHLLALNRLAIIVEDSNGKYWGFGFDNGCDKMGGTNTAGSGKAFGDLNGYTLGFSSKAKVYPYEVQSAVFSGLTTSA